MAEISTMLLGMLGGGAMGMGMGLPPLQNMLAYESNYNFPNKIPEPADLMVLLHRGLIDKDAFYRYMKAYGYSEDRAEQLWITSYNLLDASAVITLFRRGFIDHDKFVTYMARLGWSAEKADEFEVSTRSYPSLSDIVTFAVREVYTPAVRKAYGLEEDLPPEYLKEAAKVGVDAKTATDFWCAHWVLPSVEMGYEMFHRGVISLDELKTLLKVQDIMPYWRDKLVKIAYTPYTRVDVRRMYQLGVLTRDEVKRAYLDLGYDDEKAEKMTEFTARYIEEEPKTLTRTMIEDAYEQGEIDRETAVSMIVRLGYDEPNADLIIRLKETKEKEDELQDKIDTIVANFKSGVITQEQALAQIDLLDLKDTYRQKIVAKSLREQKKSQKLPEKGTLDAWLKLELIDDSAYAEYLRKMGYREEDVALFQKEIFYERLGEQEKKVREANPKLMPYSLAVKLFVELLIDEDQLREYLKALSFVDSDIELLVADAMLAQAKYVEKETKRLEKEAEETAKQAAEEAAKLKG